MANDRQSPFKTRWLAAVSVVALIGWGGVGYVFWSATHARDEAAARLLQAETARQDVTRKLDDQIKAAGTSADLQAKIALAEKQLDATTKQRDEADQQDKALRQQGDELKAATADATKARDQAQGELQRLQQSLTDAQAKLDALRTEAETNLKQARDSTATVMTEVSDSRAKVDAARQQLAGAMQAQKALIDKIAQAKSIIASALDPRTQLEADAQQADAKVAEIGANSGAAIGPDTGRYDRTDGTSSTASVGAAGRRCGAGDGRRGAEGRCRCRTARQRRRCFVAAAAD